MNPGLFLEYATPLDNAWRVTAGARVDYASAEVIADPSELASLGTRSTADNPISLADILGTGDMDPDFLLGAAYVTGQYSINDCWTAEAAVGYAERPPVLTELYAAQTFMFVLQNGVNTVTGDPRLNKERLCQIDVGLQLDNGWLRGRIGGFYGWAWDYITFENLGIVRSPPVRHRSNRCNSSTSTPTWQRWRVWNCTVSLILPLA